MKDIISKLENLNINKNITLYKDFNLKNLFKGIGRVPGMFDEQLMELLKYTNGASILDYCLLGFKNPKLGTDIDKFFMELWSSNDFLAGKFIGFMLDSTGGTFGYLIGKEFEFSNSKIISYSKIDEPDRLYILGSSFNIFFSNFLDDIFQTILESDENELLVSVDMDEWPMVIEHWLKRDNNLEKIYFELGIKKNGILQL